MPDLAESWEVLDEGSRYRFHLLPHIQFHDGRELSADDVLLDLYGSGPADEPTDEPTDQASPDDVNTPVDPSEPTPAETQDELPTVDD